MRNRGISIPIAIGTRFAKAIRKKLNITKMIKTKLIVFFFALTSTVYGQFNFGFQIETGINILRGISSDTIVPYGYSGAEYSVDDKFYASPSLRFRKNITSKISLETGLGYLPINQHIRLKYYYNLFRVNVDETLHIDLHYLSVPIACNYAIPVKNNSSFLLTAGFNTNFLISRKDNFQQIILEEIYFIKRDWYTKVVFVPRLSAAYQTNVKDLGTAEIGLFVSRDFNPYVRKDKIWGFYKNLRTARNFRYGIRLNYFFNS
jgi:outer membrane protein with beta-barrel domain